MSLWKFKILGNEVKYGEKKRKKLTSEGCNEPYKDRYWCPKLEWFRKEQCPFQSQTECECYRIMCGSI